MPGEISDGRLQALKDTAAAGEAGGRFVVEIAPQDLSDLVGAVERLTGERDEAKAKVGALEVHRLRAAQAVALMNLHAARCCNCSDVKTCRLNYLAARSEVENHLLTEVIPMARSLEPKDIAGGNR